MSEGHVTHAEKQGVHILRYFGKVDFTLAPGIQRFVDRLFDDSISGMVFLPAREQECDVIRQRGVGESERIRDFLDP